MDFIVKLEPFSGHSSPLSVLFEVPCQAVQSEDVLRLRSRGRRRRRGHGERGKRSKLQFRYAGTTENMLILAVNVLAVNCSLRLKIVTKSVVTL